MKKIILGSLLATSLMFAFGGPGGGHRMPQGDSNGDKPERPSGDKGERPDFSSMSFEEIQASILERLANKSDATTEIACVEAATSMDELKDCRPNKGQR